MTSPLRSVPITPFARLSDHSARAFDSFGIGYLPGLLGIEMVVVEPTRIVCRADLRQDVLAPHGFLHGGFVVTVADTACGYGAIVNLPPDASGFVTVELKTNFLGSSRGGALTCTATPIHIGGNTHVWDAIVRDEASERMLAMFRCTQMVLRGRKS